MREMKNSGVEWIGEIPAEWKIVKVKQAFFRKNEKAQQENPVVLSLARSGVKVRDITANEGQIAESYYNYNPVSIGDLLLNPMDLYSGANCSISKVEGVISPAYANLRSKEGYFSNFYDYYFKVQYWMMVLFAHGKGVSFDNRWTLTNETLMNFPVVAPSLTEQHRIADFLDEKCAKIDAVIEKQKQVIEKLKEYKLSVITEAVTKGLDPTVPMKDSGVEWIGEVPCDAEVVSVSKIFKIVLGKMLSTKAVEDNETLEKYFCAANVHFDTIDYDNLKQMWFSDYEKNIYKVKKGDLLVVEGGAGAGGANVVSLDVEDCYIQNSIMIVRSLSYIRSKWLYYYLYSLVKRNYIDYVCNKATIPHFTKDKLSKTKIVVFSENETEIILKELDETVFKVDETITQKQSIIDKLTEYKKSLIYEVITGKKEV